MVVLIHSVNFFFKGLDGILEVGNLKKTGFMIFLGRGGDGVKWLWQNTQNWVVANWL